MATSGVRDRGKKKTVTSAAWRSAPSPLPYNPLDKSHLGRSVEMALLETPRVALDSVPPFHGAGIYAVYFVGAHRLYSPICGAATPIYVGRAVPAGGRKGKVSEDTRTRTLWKRIDEHHQSIDQADDLRTEDFELRYLVTDELFIALAERLMIQSYRPVWNQVVDGFGNHDPGTRRRDSARPPWDELHPGRWWSELMTRPSKIPADVLEERIAAHFREHPPIFGGVAGPPEADPSVPVADSLDEA